MQQEQMEGMRRAPWHAITRESSEEDAGGGRERGGGAKTGGARK